MRMARYLILALLSVSLLAGYSFWIASPGIPLRRTDTANIRFLVNQAVAAGIK